jgi:hypothetical protein
MDYVTFLKLHHLKQNTNFIESTYYFSKFSFLYRAVDVSPNMNEEFYMVAKEWAFQFIRHLFENGRFTDGTYASLLYQFFFKKYNINYNR